MLIRTQDKTTIYNLNKFHSINVSTYNNNMETSAILLTYSDGKHYRLGHYDSKKDAMMVLDIIEHYYSKDNDVVYYMPQADEVPMEFNCI